MRMNEKNSAVNPEALFLKAFFEALLEFKEMPKYQYERRIDGFIGFFLPAVLHTKYNLNVTEIIPEFPVRADKESMRSNNIDYFIYDSSQRFILQKIQGRWCPLNPQDGFIGHHLPPVLIQSRQVKRFRADNHPFRQTVIEQGKVFTEFHVVSDGKQFAAIAQDTV